jgi:ankyrin repeat protein
VKYLVLQGAEINVTDVMNNTPLHLASIGGFSKIVEFLVSPRDNNSLQNVEMTTDITGFALIL